MNTLVPSEIAGLPRRLGAMLYDALLVFAVLILASALTLPFTTRGYTGFHLIFGMYYLAVLFGFFGWFWTHGGQTLGMKAWRLQLQTIEGKAIHWRRALLRFLLSLPFWIYTGVIVLTQNLKPGSQSGLTTLATIPAAVLWGSVILWLFLDYWPNNWRDRLSKCRVLQLQRR